MKKWDEINNNSSNKGSIFSQHYKMGGLINRIVLKQMQKRLIFVLFNLLIESKNTELSSFGLILTNILVEDISF